MSASRRRGGRAARAADSQRAVPEQRAAGDSWEGRILMSPALPGGQYRPLTEAQVAEVHGATMALLGEVGFSGHHLALTELCVAAGARTSEHGRLCFSLAMIEDAVASAAHAVTLHGRDSRLDLDVSAQRVHRGTGGAATRVLDPGARAYRATTLADLERFARVADALPNVHWFSPCVAATDIADPLERDLAALQASATATAKHLGCTVSLTSHLAPVVDLLHSLAGGAARFAERPFCHLVTRPVVSPLRFAEEGIELTLAAVRAGLPVQLVTEPLAGATAPASLAGLLAQSMAEVLGALLVVNAASPGHPAVIAPWAGVSDLRNGNVATGGPEPSLVAAAAAQMAAFYDLPCSVAAGRTDAKVPDGQAGAERTLGTTLAALAGANLIAESPGTLAGLAGTSTEMLLLDDDAFGAVRRALRGMETDDDRLAVALVRDTALRNDHFGAAAQTLALMTREYEYPTLADRAEIAAWEYDGSRDARDHAIAALKDL